MRSSLVSATPLRRAVFVIATASTLTMLGACSSPNLPAMQASVPAIYLQSHNGPYPVAMCLDRMLPGVQIERHDADGQVSADLLVKGGEWLVNVGPSAEGGTLIAAHRGHDSDDAEPAVRYAIARCAL